MNINNIKVLFYLYKNKTNQSNECSIRCRITHFGVRKQFSTGLFINASLWNSKRQKAEPPNDEIDTVNKQLSLIKSKINKAFLILQIHGNNFTVNDIYTLYKGEKLAKEYNVVEYFEMHLIKLKKLIGIGIKQATWDKFYYVKNNVKSFIKHNYKVNDFSLKKLDLQFLEDLDYYLKVEKHQQQITINKSIQRFKKPIKIAVAEGYLDKDPFILHKSKRVKKEIVFLTTNELTKLEEHQFSQFRLQRVKDWFVFSCYTGLAYNELNRLSRKHIVKGFDGVMWIEMVREKTQKNIAIPILPKARMLIDKYDDDNSELIFQIVSNQRYNSYLKEIASILGIDKRLTTHTARKTFARTVLLYNDVPMEIVSELLGHSSMAVTQESYGKVVQRKVSEEMRKLNKKLTS
jgi:integrase